MLLGDRSYFTKAHYEAHTGVAPPDMCELAVRCLELVSQLSHTGLRYRFKGGNSQLILLDTPGRFSIDVDIVTTVEKETLAATVEGIAASCELFTRCEVRPHLTKPWLPILSFKLFFESVFDGVEEPFVVLDTVFEPAPYGGVVKKIECGEIYSSQEMVELPSISGLLADKMLCISPATVGIPLGKNKEAHRLKHAFDVANLSRHDVNWDEMRTALAACLAQENRIQKSAFTFPEVAQDTIRFLREPLAHAAPPTELPPGTYIDEIARGFPDVGSYLFRHAYSWERLQADCRDAIAAVEKALEGF